MDLVHCTRISHASARKRDQSCTPCRFFRTDDLSSQHRANDHNGGRGTARNVCLQQPGSRPRCRGSVSQRQHPWGNPPRRQAASDSCWGAASYTFLECGATGANRVSLTLHTSINRKGTLPEVRTQSRHAKKENKRDKRKKRGQIQRIRDDGCIAVF